MTAINGVEYGAPFCPRGTLSIPGAWYLQKSYPRRVPSFPYNLLPVGVYRRRQEELSLRCQVVCVKCALRICEAHMRPRKKVHFLVVRTLLLLFRIHSNMSLCVRKDRCASQALSDPNIRQGPVCLSVGKIFCRCANEKRNKNARCILNKTASDLPTSAVHNECILRRICMRECSVLVALCYYHRGATLCIFSPLGALRSGAETFCTSDYYGA